MNSKSPICQIKTAVVRRLLAAVAGGMLCGLSPVAMSAARADAVGYLVNITVRRGYHFTGADDAVRYGYTLCDQVERKIGYGDIINAVKRDQGTVDGYQAAYLVNQAVDELCPAQIWQLRQSAAGYQNPGPLR